MKMPWLLPVIAVLLCCGLTPARGTTPVLVQDFEKASSLPKLGVVNIPNENASVTLSPDHPAAGKQCLKLHYHFTGAGQYLVIDNPVSIKAPIHKLHFMLYGNSSGCGYGVYLTDASGQTHKYRHADTMKIDFTGWKEITVDLDAPHETWGGDKSGKIGLPIAGITFEVSTAGKVDVNSDLYFDTLVVDSDKSAAETLGCEVSVTSPAYCSDIKGDTTIAVAGPGFKTLTAKCWKQGPGFGADSTVATVALDADGNGSFVFPANDYPHGPITIRIGGDNGSAKDNCYLQLYNQGGVSWNEGMPKDPPPAAEGMKLVFADDFSGPLSISSTDPKATYYPHKPPGGYQDFSSLPFTDFHAPHNPFAKVDNYLRIRASEKAHSSGLISSVKNDASGVRAAVPCYFECRFIGPNAIGTWPAFWLMTDYMPDEVKGKHVPCDELDIIEAYGGEGPHHPNAYDLYMVTPHAWNQGDAGKAMGEAAYKQMHNPISMHKFGIPSTWYETFHTYGCKITATDTIYYCDNIEVGRHPTLDLSKKSAFFFMINLATGGGWPVDLSRYDGLADMYVAFVRVYSGAPAPAAAPQP
jgi:hypothetical protein